MSSDIVEFETPAGHIARYWYRTDTTDWNTLASCCREDEYGIPAGVDGWAADVGAHIGGATVPLALDNPTIRVIAVEPLPENLRALDANVAANGVEDRVVILAGAVGTSRLFYGWDATESMRWHRYIGNMTGATGTAQTVLDVETFTLADLLAIAGGELAYLKTDCEGGEWTFLDDPLVAHVAVIAGEWHGTDGHTADDIVALLSPTHHVSAQTGQGGGGFRAIRR